LGLASPPTLGLAPQALGLASPLAPSPLLAPPPLVRRGGIAFRNPRFSNGLDA